jgi:sugar transferase (PEP-CTERM/EpsH1 system associated)
MAEILFLAHRAPWPPDRGDRIRSWHMLEALLKLAPVHVAALVDNYADEAVARAKLAPLCASLHLSIRRRTRPAALLQSLAMREPASVRAFGNSGLRAHVAGLLRHGDITRIVGFSGQMAQYLPPRSHFSGPVLMDLVDVDSAKFEQFGRDAAATSPLGWVNRREGRMLAAYEAGIAARADVVSFVSEAEAALFRQRSGATNVVALENGIDTSRFDPAGGFTPLDFDTRPLGPLCVFTGQMDYQPNVDAVTHFARESLPALRQQVKAASFAIVGRAPTREVLALEAIPGVLVTGEVPDTRPWLAAADVVVAPLKLARGVQNKLLEAMAMAKPIVASSAAAQGIDAQDSQHLLVADGAPATAAAVTALLRDPARRSALGMAARERMIARYGWDATMAPLAKMLAMDRAAS